MSDSSYAYRTFDGIFVNMTQHCWRQRTQNVPSCSYFRISRCSGRGMDYCIMRIPHHNTARKLFILYNLQPAQCHKPSEMLPYWVIHSCSLRERQNVLDKNCLSHSLSVLNFICSTYENILRNGRKVSFEVVRTTISCLQTFILQN